MTANHEGAQRAPLGDELLDFVADPRSLRREQLLQATAIGVVSATGEAFFRLLTRHLAHTLQCTCAVVGVLMPNQVNRVRTLALYADHQLLPNIEYDLAGTPCDNVVSSGMCVYPSEVRQLFPADQWLQDWGIEAYAGMPLVDSHGKVLGLMSVLSRQPMTDADAVRSALQIFAVRAAAEVERQQTEESLRASQAALAESEERFRQMAENIRDLYWLYDVRERRLLYLSPAYESIWGRPPDWVLEEPDRWLEGVHEDDRARAGAVLTPAAPGKIYDNVYRIVWPDGTIRWLHDRRYAVLDAAGQFVRLVGVAEDVTESKEAAEKLEQQIAHLAHMARLSTVGELVASIAHEINQPLYAIANYSSAIGAALESPNEMTLTQVRRWNSEIAKAAVRAGEVIRRVRSYVARGTTSRLPTDLSAVVQESAALFASEARRQRVRVHLDLKAPAANLVADPVAIQQVLVNLIRNALEAMSGTPPSQRAIDIRTRQRSGEVEVSIQDSGCGLPEDDMQRLFTAFYTTKPEGMGLGLAISKTIIQAHHGRIWATRNTHRGSTFHFTLPLGE